MEPPSPWKRPNEVMQLHKLKKRKKALQAGVTIIVKSFNFSDSNENK